LSEPFARLAQSASGKRKVPFRKRKEPTDLQRIFFLPDTHVPYHNRQALALVLQVIESFKPDIFVSIGDYVDCFSVSNYSKDPRRAFRLDEEFEQANVILDQIDKLTVGARRIYIAGNHEHRLERYLQEKAPELFSFIDIQRLLRLEERGWEYVPYKQATTVGKLNLTHDVGSAGRYNAFRALDTFQAPVVTGHTHRLSYVVEGDATGGSQVSSQFGWLGDVEQIDYLHRVKAMREWTLGFGYGYLEVETGHVHLTPVPIVKHSCVVEGKLYRVDAEAVAA
jgi:predicted phosphodiesterase